VEPQRLDIDAIEMYVFDTSGVLYLPTLLQPDEIERCRSELSQLREEPPPFPSTRRWERLSERSSWFDSLAADTRLLNRARDVINQPLRLIESYGIHRESGGELLMHGGSAELMDLPWGGTASQDVSISHSYKDGKLYCMYVKILIYLDDINSPADGMFSWLAGSHKANFPLVRPWYCQSDPSKLSGVPFPNLCRLPVRAGDALLINEGVLHGATLKTTAGPRRFVAFSYGPSFMSNWREMPATGLTDLHDCAYADADVEEIFLPPATADGLD
jgi:Phytanoyl-CoA dioxygenase (PhyH)